MASAAHLRRLVAALSTGEAAAREAAAAELGKLAFSRGSNQVAIAEAGGTELRRGRSSGAPRCTT